MVALARIQSYADEIARRFRPERIILFGSHATGRAGADSDVDLLVVMPVSGDLISAAATIRASIDREFPLDLIVRDPESLRWRLKHNDCFLREIVDRGAVLYEAHVA